MQIQIDTSEVKIFFHKIEDRAKNLSAPMKLVSNAILNSVHENFLQGGRYSKEGSILGGATKWEKTKAAPTYKSGKAKGQEKGQTLLRSQMLFKSITPIHDSESAGVSSGMVYARIHNYGGKAGKNKSVSIRARPFMVIQPEDIEYAKETLLDHLTK